MKHSRLNFVEQNSISLKIHYTNTDIMRGTLYFMERECLLDSHHLISLSMQLRASLRYYDSS